MKILQWIKNLFKKNNLEVENDILTLQNKVLQSCLVLKENQIDNMAANLYELQAIAIALLIKYTPGTAVLNKEEILNTDNYVLDSYKDEITNDYHIYFKENKTDE